MLFDPNPPQFPAHWAMAWGEDSYGLWQAVEINGVRQVMRWIPPGEFLMGSPADEVDRRDNETQHPVQITKGFWLAETACTQELWQAVMGDNPGHFTGNAQRPVESVSWEDSQRFINQANERLAGSLRLDLPSEAQWEYACRAGTQTPFSFGETISTEQANFDGNHPYAGGEKGQYREKTVAVDALPPNPWGLYQMHGNVWEWCADWYGEYEPGRQEDPTGPQDGVSRVLRGGSWFSDARSLRSAYRFRTSPGLRYRLIGLRLAGG